MRLAACPWSYQLIIGERKSVMIDLHCHLLPGIDDGSKDLEMSLAMARMASSDGISTIACTPHILPGVYRNTGPAIRTAVAQLQESISEAGIPIALVTGADVHVAPDLGVQLREGKALTLNDSRYFLLEPPHHLLPPRLEDLIFGLQAAGYVPILTHPERLSWIEDHYDLIERFACNSVLMQITAGSLMGQFGRRPRYWAERMLDDGLCHLLATDAHNTERRPPRMAEARELIAQRIGHDEATNMVLGRPQCILNNLSPTELPVLPQAPRTQSGVKTASWGNIINRIRRRAGALMKEVGVFRRLLVLAVAGPLLLSNCMETTQTNQSGETSMGAVVTGQRASASALARDEAQANAAIVGGQSTLASARASGEMTTDYKISPQDILQIAVFQIKDLDSAVQVGEDGFIALPLVGKIQVRGKTTYEAEQTIAGKLREKYLQSPQVSVSIKQYGKRITISGEVKTPRVLPDDGATTLSQAVANAGGLSEIGDPTRIHIAQSKDQRVQDEIYNLSDIQAGKARDPLLRGGDIVVAESSGTRVALKTVKDLLPFAMLATIM